ncbi:hypothetical protein CPT_Magnus_035 [Klebsiella phage Magnus]|uniref:Uncharacterized protein n=1 Tax=Klebsiella phage Magnus TaxID=2589660 RepID=A0A5B9N2C0_9CAUD|nr:hypothetical protein HYP92_gp206 [Klebsiella phage Magnus]QEG07914.1 hypothetical protein CPT_Magnus_035 [Klebsiella phage Magnus]
MSQGTSICELERALGEKDHALQIAMPTHSGHWWAPRRTQ